VECEHEWKKHDQHRRKCTSCGMIDWNEPFEDLSDDDIKLIKDAFSEII
jgi:hypothetical protein